MLPHRVPGGWYRLIALHRQRHSLFRDFRELNDADRRSGPMQAMQIQSGRAVEVGLSEVDATEA
jgi:hypothetical protein